MIHIMQMLYLGWKFSIDQQIGNLQKRCLLCQFLNGISSILQNALVAINEADCTLHHGRVLICWIIECNPRMSLVGEGLEERGRNGMIMDGNGGLCASAMINDSEIFWISRYG